MLNNARWISIIFIHCKLKKQGDHSAGRGKKRSRINKRPGADRKTICPGVEGE
jgi:hypothetical protein